MINIQKHRLGTGGYRSPEVPPIPGNFLKGVSTAWDGEDAGPLYNLSRVQGIPTMCGGRLIILNKLGDGADHPSLHEAYPFCPTIGEWEYGEWENDASEDIWHPYSKAEMEAELESYLRSGRYTRSLADIFDQYPFVELLPSSLREMDMCSHAWGYCLFTLVGAWNPEELEYIRSMLSKMQHRSRSYVCTVTELRKEHDWLISLQLLRDRDQRLREGDIERVEDTGGNFGWDWDMLLDPAINRAAARRGNETSTKALWCEQGDVRVMYNCGFDKEIDVRDSTKFYYFGMPAGRTKYSVPWHDAIARQVLQLARYNETNHVYMTDNCMTSSLEYRYAVGVPSHVKIMTGTKSFIVYLIRNWRWVKQALATHDPAYTWSYKLWPLASNPNERDHDIMGMSLFRTPTEEES